MTIIISFLILLLNLFCTQAWATVPVMRFPSGTVVQVCQASDTNPSCGSGGGSGTFSSLGIQDEGVGIGTATTLNCAGAGVACAISNNVVTATISGSALTLGGGLNAVQYQSPVGSLAGNESIFSFNGTNIGIGTSNARQLLEVTTGNAYINGGNLGIGTATTTNKLDLVGSVAIGSTYGGAKVAPTDGLIVQGNVGLGTFTLNGSFNNTIWNSAYFRSTVNIGTVAVSSVPLQVYTNGTPSAYFSSDNSGTAVTNTAGPIISNTNSTSGDYAGIQFSFTHGGNGLKVGAKSSPSRLFFSGTGTTEDMVIDTSSANVGIGTTVPPNKLYIAGTGEMQGFKLPGNGAAAGNVLVSSTVGIGTWMAASTLPISAGSSVAGGLNAVQYNSPLGTQAGSEAVFSMNGTNVGINTTNGRTALEVTSGNVGIGTFLNKSALAIKDGVSIGAAYADKTIPTGQLAVLNNVGIGTWAPQAVGTKLEVAGTIIMSSGNFQAGTNATTAATIFSSNNTMQSSVYFPPGGGAIGSAASPTFSTSQTEASGMAGIRANNVALIVAGGEKISINNNGNVGIGTIGPVQRLSVVGNIGIGTVTDGDLFLSTAPPNGGMIIEKNVGIGSVTPGSQLDVQGTARIIGAGNVGIGSTNPGQALDVNGNIRTIEGLLISVQTTTPTASSCGTTPGVTAKSTDVSGSVTIGSGVSTTSCTIALKKTHTVAPNCICGDDTSILAIKCAANTTTLTMTSATSMSGDLVTWICPDNQ